MAMRTPRRWKPVQRRRDVVHAVEDDALRQFQLQHVRHELVRLERLDHGRVEGGLREPERRHVRPTRGSAASSGPAMPWPARWDAMHRRGSGCDRVRGGSEPCSDDPAVAQRHVRTACERACLFVACILDTAIH